MRLISKTLAAVALFGAIAVLHADTNAPVPEVAPTTSPRSTLTVVEMRSGAQTVQATVQAELQAVVRLQEKVRASKDIIKLTCVNDRLVQIKAQANIVESTQRQLEDALSKDSEDRFRLYGDLEVAAAGAQKLREEATTCVGEPELYKGEQVEVNHPDFPDNPVADNPFDDAAGADTDVEPPGYASLFY
jgi:hypothetical protein